ncbi:MAG TPA: alpha/beta hydrolase domain-containing protein, partial [Casimicrobiaceae bacterium]
MIESRVVRSYRLLPSIVRRMALACFAIVVSTAFAAVPNPTVTGPVASPVAPGDSTHNYVFFSSNHDLAGHGYVEEEFFIQGTANRYNTPSLATATIIDAGHPYMTRMVVRRPIDPAKFNGTVLVEWYNVSNNFDAENVWFFAWEHMMRAGYVWVGVSAQRVGVTSLKAWSPVRYGSLDVTQGGTIT